MKIANQIFKVFVELLKDTADILKELFIILIPAIVIVKILQEVGAIEYLSQALEPAMSLFGLPGEMAIVFTTGIVANIYGAISVFIMLAGELTVSTAQMTVLSLMILVCHSMPVELALTHRVGGNFVFMGLLRFIGAAVSGFILHNILKATNTLQQSATILWSEQAPSDNLIDWVFSQVHNLIFISVVLFCLLTLMKILNKIGFTEMLGKILKPVLILMGISPKGASITVFGLLAGITFGSGLLLAEVKKNSVSSKDIVLVLTFLSLCHGIIEDTALMLLIGGDISGILFFRFAFAIMVLAVFSRLPINFSALRSNGN